jgi:hypothetical protein
MLGKMGDPVHQAGKKTDSWHQTVEEVRRRLDVSKMSEGMENGFDTTPKRPHAQSMYHRVHYVEKSVMTLIIVIVSLVLMCLSVSGE